MLPSEITCQRPLPASGATCNTSHRRCLTKVQSWLHPASDWLSLTAAGAHRPLDQALPQSEERPSQKHAGGQICFSRPFQSIYQLSELSPRISPYLQNARCAIHLIRFWLWPTMYPIRPRKQILSSHREIWSLRHSYLSRLERNCFTLNLNCLYGKNHADGHSNSSSL